MAIVAGLVSMAGRFAGRVLNTTLGWATMLLFGKVPQSRQMLLLVIVFGAIVWVALIIGVLFPDVGTLMVAAVPLPDFIEETWVRIAMLIGALVTPLLIGMAAMFIVPKDKRPRGVGQITGALRGYPFSAVLALSIVVLAVVASVRKVRAMAKRWESVHVPLIAKPGGYERVVDDVQQALAGAGLELERRPASALVAMPARLLDAVAGKTLGSLVPDKLIELRGPTLEVLVYPSDLAIVGSKVDSARARAAIVSTLTRTPAYQTSTAEAQNLEDEIQRLVERESGLSRGVRMEALDKRLATLVVPYEDWDILYRQRLQLETTDSLAGDAADERTATPAAGERDGRSPGGSRLALDGGRLEAIGAIGLAGLVIADIALLTARRLRPGSRR